MSTSGIELKEAVAQGVAASDEALTVDLADGRTITVPLAWFPRLAHGTPAERSNWRLIGGGVGIHWPSEITEDPGSPLNVLQLFTFYTMEHRADAVGERSDDCAEEQRPHAHEG